MLLLFLFRFDRNINAFSTFCLGVDMYGKELLSCIVMNGVVNAIRLMKEPPMRLSATTLLLLLPESLLLEVMEEVVWSFIDIATLGLWIWKAHFFSLSVHRLSGPRTLSLAVLMACS